MQARGKLGSALLAASTTLLGCERVSQEDLAARQRLLQHVRQLAQEIGSRPTGSPAEARAREYILHNLEEAGLAVSEKPVPQTRINDTTGLGAGRRKYVG